MTDGKTKEVYFNHLKFQEFLISDNQSSTEIAGPCGMILFLFIYLTNSCGGCMLDSG